VLPWSTFWEQNYFSTLWPSVGHLLTNNFVRGGISGLGLVNLCAGFIDLSVVFGARERLGRGSDFGDYGSGEPPRSRADDVDVGQPR
jgi:hypothetical protein